MKKSLLVLNSIFAIALIWAFVYFFIFGWANGFAFGMRNVWIMFLPVAVCGLLVIPVNSISLFVWSRQSAFFKKIFSAFGGAAIIILPIVDFIYIIILTLLLFPILFEISVCSFQPAGDRYCFLYLRSPQLVIDFFWIFIFLLFSAALVRWNIFQVKKDKKFLLVILAVFIGLSSVVLYFKP